MRNTVKASRVGLPVVALVALLAATSDVGTAVAEPAPSGPGPADEGTAADGEQRWQEDATSTSATAAGVRQQADTLVLDDRQRPEWSWPGGGLEGHYTFPARQLAHPVNRLSATVTAKQPTGTTVAVDVRGLMPSGRWTEWQPVSADRPVVAPFATTRIQVRVALGRDFSAGSASPEVSGVALSADVAPAGTASTATPAAAAPTYPIFATREGLVGRTTANGHVIKPNDHFVALPSRRALNANDQTRDYKVRVCNPRNKKCVEAPVWDVGPWNIHDDYWNPSNVRQTFRDLPQGKPEAQAAYFQGYNNGLDERGRRTNGAGIDLADGTWAALGMTGNDFVDVTYLWKAS